MISKKDVCIVIPLYKEVLDDGEIISLKHLIKFLGDYDKYFISPDNLSIKLKGFLNKKFNRKYFESVGSFIDLMNSKEFYESFRNYKYMMIYHLDCLVFSDQLLYWCNKGYDFIGAPWYKEVLDWVKQDSVGNGGFCLKKIKSFLHVLDYVNPKKVCKKDDIFWGIKVKRFFPDFRVAPPEEAVKFAFETAPKFCFKKNNYQLPFGCHAWEKYNKKFWEKYLVK